MVLPLMPKATAMWLIENTALSFEQISEFTGLHTIEIQAMADGEVSMSIKGADPILNNQLTLTEIKRCEADPNAKVQLNINEAYEKATKKGAKYTPVAKRQDKPDAIAWLLKQYPEIPVSTVCTLIGTTKPTVTAIKEKTHWNMSNIKPRNPVVLGLCSDSDIERALKIK